MAFSTLNRGGKTWTPKFLVAIDDETCIGCGRCFRVCGRDVMGLQGITEEGDRVDSDDDDAIRQVMTLTNEGNCIGCGACNRVCPKSCQTFEALDVAAA